MMKVNVPSSLNYCYRYYIELTGIRKCCSHGNMVFLFFFCKTANGGMGIDCRMSLKQLAEKLAEADQKRYAVVIA